MASHRPIRTSRLTLLPADVARLEPLVCNSRSFTLLTGFKVADQFCAFDGAMKSSLNQLRRARNYERPWLTPRLLVFDLAAEVIGVAVFQAPPKEGRIELGYSVAPSHQNLGFATEAVQALTDYAARFPEVHTVTAQTMPEKTASMRVLEKCGFERVGESVDRVRGPVWTWERALKMALSA